DDLSAAGPRVRTEIRHPLHRLVQRGVRLGLRQRNPDGPAGLRDDRQVGEGRSHSRPWPSGGGVDLRTPPFHVPARADGAGSRIPPVGRDKSMDANRNDLLGEIASDAALERTDFLVTATDQLRKFLDSNAHRVRALGGLTLIDDDPDFLSIAPDLTFRSRSRYLDD